jgi:glycosyltransferase involved in cell wall biosynthesis
MFDYSKIIVAHPGRQHSFRLAEALERHGMLFKYVTTVYDSSNSFWMKLTKLFIRGDDLNRANKRKISNVNDSKIIQFCELLGLILLLVYRFDKSQRFSRAFSKFVSYCFQRKLANYIIKNKIGIVISYDCNSSILFDILKAKAPNVIRIIDDAHPNRNYLYKVYNDILDTAGDFAKTYQVCGYLTDKKCAETYGEEARKANFHIVASNFSMKSVLYNGFKENQIILAPYGVSNSSFKPVEKNYTHGLNVLFVGEVNQRKGIAQILESARQLKIDGNNDIEFNIVGGGSSLCSELYEPYKKIVHLRGRVSFEDLQKYYGLSHIFVFPSVGEGFGLVILEALSAGLPVIASRNCGGPDIIQDGYNGFLIDAGSTEQLKEKILWFQNHMEELPQMSRNAVQSVSNMTWEHYGDNLVKQLKTKINYLSRQSQ